MNENEYAWMFLWMSENEKMRECSRKWMKMNMRECSCEWVKMKKCVNVLVHEWKWKCVNVLVNERKRKNARMFLWISENENMRECSCEWVKTKIFLCRRKSSAGRRNRKCTPSLSNVNPPKQSCVSRMRTTERSIASGKYRPRCCESTPV